MSYKHIIFFITLRVGPITTPILQMRDLRLTWLKVTWLVRESNMGSLVPFIDAANMSLSTCYEPGRILGTGNTAVNTKEQVPAVTKHWCAFVRVRSDC